MGHYVAGKLLGLNCEIRYASCSCLTEQEYMGIEFGNELFSKYGKKELVPKELWEEYIELRHSGPVVNKFWMLVGGPLQTIATGTIALFILLLLKTSKHKQDLNSSYKCNFG